MKNFGTGFLYLLSLIGSSSALTKEVNWTQTQRVLSYRPLPAIIEKDGKSYHINADDSVLVEFNPSTKRSRVKYYFPSKVLSASSFGSRFFVRTEDSIELLDITRTRFLSRKLRAVARFSFHVEDQQTLFQAISETELVRISTTAENFFLKRFEYFNLERPEANFSSNQEIRCYYCDRAIFYAKTQSLLVGDTGISPTSLYVYNLDRIKRTIDYKKKIYNFGGSLSQLALSTNRGEVLVINGSGSVDVRGYEHSYGAFRILDLLNDSSIGASRARIFALRDFSSMAALNERESKLAIAKGCELQIYDYESATLQKKFNIDGSPAAAYPGCDLIAISYQNGVVSMLIHEDYNENGDWLKRYRFVSLKE